MAFFLNSQEKNNDNDLYEESGDDDNRLRQEYRTKEF